MSKVTVSIYLSKADTILNPLDARPDTNDDPSGEETYITIDDSEDDDGNNDGSAVFDDNEDHYGSAAIDDDDDNEGPAVVDPQSDPYSQAFPERFEIDSYDIGHQIIAAGNTVELRDHTERTSESPLSGDFMRIQRILEDTSSGEVSIEGYRLRRCSYLQPMFNSRCSWLLKELH